MTPRARAARERLWEEMKWAACCGTTVGFYRGYQAGRVRNGCAVEEAGARRVLADATRESRRALAALLRITREEAKCG